MFKQDFFTLSFFVPSSHSRNFLDFLPLFPLPLFFSNSILLIAAMLDAIQSCMCTIPTPGLESSSYCLCVNA
ncbi:hypothetical protein AMTRI_Chr01g128310 [Amborella trichopoda]